MGDFIQEHSLFSQALYLVKDAVPSKPIKGDILI